MSFLRNLYNKMASNDTTRKDSFVVDNVNSRDFDEYMEEDGFVVLTEKPTTKVQMHMHDRTGKVEFDNFQRSVAPSSFLAETLQTAARQYGDNASYKDNTINASKKESSTFLTASDLPMKLAKHLELVSKINVTSSGYSRKPDFEQFYYDFHLERKIIGCT